MNALRRGVELFSTKGKDMPLLALRYAKELCAQVGMCGEVMLTAYCIYAELEEGLPKSPDTAYQFHEDERYRTMVDNARRSTWKPEWWDGLVTIDGKPCDTQDITLTLPGVDE